MRTSASDRDGLVDVDTSVSGNVPTDPNAVLKVSGLKAGYAGRPVVHGVNLELRAGTITAVFGHNGAGKSTTMKAITGLLSPFDGTVELFGQDVTGLSASSRVGL